MSDVYDNINNCDECGVLIGVEHAEDCYLYRPSSGSTTGGAERPKVDRKWKEVTCSDCGRTYQCTPFADYYNSTTLTDGLCERCLLTQAVHEH